MNIPFSPPDIGIEEVKAVSEALKSGWITTGPKTKELENKVADYCNTEKAVCLNSATACMETTLRLLGVGEGDEVITSAYTYTASASVIHHVGAKIVLVDTKKESYEMDYEQVANAITKKTKAIIPVDLAGIMCDYKTLNRIVEEKKFLFEPKNEIQKTFSRIIIIADSAHSFGAIKDYKKSGEVADFTCFSFHAVKNLTTAEGGAVTWKPRTDLNSEEIYKKYMLFSLHGQTKDALSKSKIGLWEYDIEILGYKNNMTDIHASIGLAQINRYKDMLSRRKEIIETYNKGLCELPVRYLEHYNTTDYSSGHLYLMNLLNKTENERNSFIVELAKKGIATNVHYKPLPMLTAYRNLGFKIEDFPNAYNLYKNEVTLPVYSVLKDAEIEFIIESIKKIIK